MVSARLAGESLTCGSRIALRATRAAGCDDWRRASRTAGIVTTPTAASARHRIALKLVDRPELPDAEVCLAPAGTPKSMVQAF